MNAKLFFTTIIISVSLQTYSQVGIGTTNPEGALDIVATNLGLVLPRVTDIESVTDGSGNNAVAGTVVYDQSRNQTCFRIGSEWLCFGIDSDGNPEIDVPKIAPTIISNYVKASNTNTSDNFAENLSVSADGNRFVISARNEDSNATGVNGNEANNSASASGAVYVFNKSGGVWAQEAYIKASNTSNVDNFGSAVALNNDGSVLAVGARREDSNATGVNGDQTNNSATDSGAVYVFKRIGTTWSQDAYIKASNTDALDYFGDRVALSGDGAYLAVGALQEDSNATGINGDGTNNSASRAGAAYVFYDNGTSWSEQAYFKGDNTEVGDRFGSDVALNYDGTILAVGAHQEDSNATGVNGDGTNNAAFVAGAAYVFNRSGTTWTQDAYIKPLVIDSGDFFGVRLSLSSNGLVLVINSVGEDSSATGINGDSTLNDASSSGAAYIFRKSAGVWAQEAYIKASNTEADDVFGYHLSISANGCRLLVGAYHEDSNATGVDGDQTNNSTAFAGGAYLYKHNGSSWEFESYLKASNTDPGDRFGSCVGLSSSGSLIVIGADREQSTATGLNGDQTNNSGGQAGAAYIIE